MSMMLDLGLDKVEPSQPLKPSFGGSGYFGARGVVRADVLPTRTKTATSTTRARTLEERRTYLGCFFMTSMYVSPALTVH